MKRNEKRELLLTKALEVFARYGYRKATVEDIAGEIGLTKGGIYKYVDSKIDLYQKSVSHALGKWQDRVAEAVAGEDDIVEKFKVMSSKGYEYLMEDENLQAVLKNDPTVFPYSPHVVRFKEINERSLGLIQNLLREGIKENKFVDVDIVETSELLYSIYRMFIIEAYVLSDVYKLQKMYASGVTLILKGLMVRE